MIVHLILVLLLLLFFVEIVVICISTLYISCPYHCMFPIGTYKERPHPIRKLQILRRIWQGILKLTKIPVYLQTNLHRPILQCSWLSHKHDKDDFQISRKKTLTIITIILTYPATAYLLFTMGTQNTVNEENRRVL